MPILNQGLGFEEVRWLTMRKSSRYDTQESFVGAPVRSLLPLGTTLYRLVPLANGIYFNEVWWMPKPVFDELYNDAHQSRHGGGALLRNYIAQAMALPKADSQLSIVEIRLTRPVYAWVGKAAPVKSRPGGMQQVFLPYLTEPGNPRSSLHAAVVRTFGLQF